MSRKSRRRARLRKRVRKLAAAKTKELDMKESIYLPLDEIQPAAGLLSVPLTISSFVWFKKFLSKLIVQNVPPDDKVDTLKAKEWERLCSLVDSMDKISEAFHRKREGALVEVWSPGREQ